MQELDAINTHISIRSPHTRGDLPIPAACQAGGKFQSAPLTRGETARANLFLLTPVQFQSAPLTRGETIRHPRSRERRSISIRSPHTRGDPPPSRPRAPPCISIRSPHTRGDDAPRGLHRLAIPISIRSPHTRGDSISLQKSIRIYVSLHNKTMIHRFSELYKPLFAAQSPIFGVRSPWESHDSFTFARPSAGRGITP